MKFECKLVILCFTATFIKITSGDTCYGAEFSEDISGCEDFENTYLNCDTLQLGMVEGKESDLGLNGEIQVFEDIVEGIQMGVDVWKIMDIGKEYMYHVQADICENLKNTKAPWYPMIESMNVLECPIPTEIYKIKDMSISLNASKDLMTHEMVGDYTIQLTMLKDLEKLSCYELEVTVVEYNC